MLLYRMFCRVVAVVVVDVLPCSCCCYQCCCYGCFAFLLLLLLLILGNLVVAVTDVLPCCCCECFRVLVVAEDIVVAKLLRSCYSPS